MYHTTYRSTIHFLNKTISLLSDNKFFSYWVILTIVAAGLLLRLDTVLTQPIWLDEQFSLLFSQQFSIPQLLTGFSQDIHPGWYYGLVRTLLSVTTSLSVLRIITSVLPQVVGFLILTTGVLRSSRLNGVLVAAVLFLNPFFIHLSWQLRMYGLVTGLAAASLALYLLWKKHRSVNLKLLLLATLLISTSLSYIMVALAAVMGLYVLYQDTFKHKWLVMSGWLVLLASVFSILTGLNSPTQYKQQFLPVTWIAQPTIENVAGVTLTSLGLGTDVMNTADTPLVFVVLFYALLISFGLWASRHKHLLRNTFFRELTIFSLAPFGGVIVISLLFPFLSNRLFIHQFVPGVSIFIPRAVTPFVVIFLAMAALQITKLLTDSADKGKQVIIVSMTALAIGWGWTDVLLNRTSVLGNRSKQREVRRLLETKSTLLWPSLIWVEAVDTNSANTDTVEQRMAASKQFETGLLTTSQEASCSLLPSQLVIAKQVTTNARQIKQQALVSARSCCSTTHQSEFFTYWRCDQS